MRCVTSSEPGSAENPGTPEDADDEWRYISALCREVERDVPSLVNGLVRSIRGQQHAYAAIPLAEHESSVLQQCQGLMAALAARRPPTVADAELSRDLGRRRARQGLPVEALLGAYHVGLREMWSTLMARAQADDPARAVRMLGLVDLAWTWLQVNTSATADAYAETVRSREEARISLGHQFLEALYAGRATEEATELLGRALAYDTEGDLQVICCPADPWPPQRLDALRERFRELTGTLSAIVRGALLVIVFQGQPAERVLDLLERDGPSLTAGVSLLRPGLAGAAAGIVDATLTLAVAQRQGGVVRFDAAWLFATLLPQLDRLQPLVEAGTAADSPHLADAVRAYAEHGFSITASAEALHVHPNTVKYRLDRWRHHTGWDPRTLDGLLRSLLNIAFAPDLTGDSAGSS
jgi:hypothetical protein